MSKAWKRGYTSSRHAPVAQGIERSPAEAEATGSIPVGRTSPSWTARALPAPDAAGGTILRSQALAVRLSTVSRLLARLLCQRRPRDDEVCVKPEGRPRRPSGLPA